MATPPPSNGVLTINSCASHSLLTVSESDIKWATPATISMSGQLLIQNRDFDKRGGWYIGLFPKKDLPYTKSNFLIVVCVAWTWRSLPNAFVRWIVKTISLGNVVVMKDFIRRNN
jgi:hypothetical protein